MKGLLLKDFYNTKKTAALMLIIPILMGVAAYIGFTEDGQETEGFLGFVMIITIAITIAFSLSILMNSLVWDENSNYLLYALTTPIDKNIYLKSKYTFLAAVTGIFGLMSAVPMLVVLFLTGSFRAETVVELLGSVLISMMICIPTGICMLALSIKQSAAKVSSYLAAFYTMLGMTSVIINNISEETKAFIRGSIWWIAIAIILVLIVFAVIMLKKNQQWIEQKEF